MGRFMYCFRLLKCIFILNFGLFASGKISGIPSTALKLFDENETDRIPIGVVFDQNAHQIQHAFKIAMVQHATNNSTDFVDFQVYVDVINTADTFKLSRLVCNQFSRGVVTILASVHPDSFDTFHSYANTFHMPFVTPSFPEKVLTPTSRLPDYAMSILPDYHKAVIGTVMYYGWKNVIYLYDSHDGMLRLQQLFKNLVPGRPPYFRIANVKKINSAKDVIYYLRQLEKTDRWSNKYIILDCTTIIAKETIISHVRDVQLGRRNYHYLFSGLVLDERWDREILEYGTINITGFRLVDTSRRFVKDFFHTWKMDSIAASGALMYDAAHTVLESFQRILKQKPHIMENLMNKNNRKYRFLSCETQEAVPLKYGDEIADFIKKTQIEGLSGKIRFTSAGIRKSFSLVVVRNSPDGNMTKIATWYDDKGFRPVRRLNGVDNLGKYDRNKTYTVVSIQEPPYFSSSGAPKDPADGTEIQYGGFCAELAELIAEKLEISIQFRLSADGKYGNPNPNVIGGWDGMVGELVRNEVDMVVAPLLLTAEREAAVDFSKPFLSFNKIGSKTPKDDKVSTFSFLSPLSKDTWYLLVSSILLVSTVMFVVSRFSPMEWRVVAVTDTTQSLDGSETPVTRSTVINEFSFYNSVWYSVCCIMQQNSEVVPRSISGRIISTVWWFFALIIVCSYTAFLASQLTISGMEAQNFPVYNRLAHCPEDMPYEGKKEIIVDDEIHGNAENLGHRYMSQPADYVRPVSNCEVIVTVLDPGIMDFAVAFPRGSILRTGVNRALFAIREEGELNRLVRKYFYNMDCGMPLLSSRRPVELTLEEISGLFYMLLFSLAVGLCVSVLEFCRHHRSNAAKANISIKTALCAKSQLPVNEVQETRNTARPRSRDQERGWNGSVSAPGPYAGSPSGSRSRTQMITVRNNTRACSCIMNNYSLQAIDDQQSRADLNMLLQPIRDPLPIIYEQNTREILPPKIRHSVASGSLRAPFELSPSRSPMNPMRGVGPRHVMNRQRSRQVMKQIEDSREAIELTSRPYFTPAHQTGQEETALRNSLTQV